MISSKDKKILVTGSSGFIGSRLVKSFENEITIFDKKQHSLFDKLSLKPLLESCDVIYHLAGVNAGSGYEPSSSSLTRNNIDGTYNLLRAIKDYCSKPPLFVLMSSIHVYDKSNDIFSESDDLGPSSLYGMSKLAQEYLVSQADDEGLIKSLMFRASNIYGGSCRPYYNSAIATFCDQIIKNKEIPLFANGQASLDLVYVDDVVTVLRNADAFFQDQGKVYNLASGKTFTVKNIIKILQKVSNTDIKTKLLDTPALKFSISTDKMQNALPDFRLTSLEDGLKLTYKEYHELRK
tara:strand:- start:1466 stop:2344 length:879 start_codon:yes stop_codon:yes gene_type:complete